MSAEVNIKRTDRNNVITNCSTAVCPRCSYPLPGVVLLCPRCRETIKSGCSGNCRLCANNKR